MMSILKKFFAIKTRDPNFLEHPDTENFKEPNIYKFKLPTQTKGVLYLYFLSCFGCVPTCSKNHKRYQKLEKTGEERLKEFVNARYIMSILDQHHRVLNDLNTTGKKMSDRIFDYILPLSTGDEEPEPST